MEQEIRTQIEARRHEVLIQESWFTPAGNKRSSPLYTCSIENAFLGKNREIKGRSPGEVEQKINECIGKWCEQEIRKRVSEAKKDAKEQAQAEAARMDDEAKQVVSELAAMLSATLDVDDKIDWDAERDTRLFRAFTFNPPPTQPLPFEAVLPVKPGLTWLLKGRLRKWEAECEAALQWHTAEEEKRQASWLASVADSENAKAEGLKQYNQDKDHFLAGQQKFNEALVDFRKRFEAGQLEAIKEYCEQVLERSLYPEAIAVGHKVEFDAESGYVVVSLDLPSQDDIPQVSGYKFVTKGNRVDPIPMKKKDVEALYRSILDQVVVRTMHEVFEGCYTDVVKGAVVTAWTTNLDRATGKDSRAQARGISSDRVTFEAFDLSRVDASACVEKLSENIGSMSGVSE